MSWDILRAFWGVLASSYGALIRCGAEMPWPRRKPAQIKAPKRPETSWGVLGGIKASWEYPGASLGRPGAPGGVLGRLWGVLKHAGASLVQRGLTEINANQRKEAS